MVDLSVNQIQVNKIDSRQYIHRNLSSRFWMAVAVAIILYAQLWYVSINYTIFFFIVLGYAALISIIAWFSLNVLRAQLVGNSLKITPNNFPGIWRQAERCQRASGVSHIIDMYVIEEGKINSFLLRVFNIKVIVINSAVLEGIDKNECPEDVNWLISRWYGYVMMRYEYYQNILSMIIVPTKYIPIFNFFILSYDRYCVYSGDNFGIMQCNNVSGAVKGLSKMMIGKTLYPSVSNDDFIEQAIELKGSFFGWFSRIISTHPHITDRYLNMLAFSRVYDIGQFNTFISKHYFSNLPKLAEALTQRHGA